MIYILIIAYLFMGMCYSAMMVEDNFKHRYFNLKYKEHNIYTKFVALGVVNFIMVLFWPIFMLITEFKRKY